MCTNLFFLSTLRTRPFIISASTRQLVLCPGSPPRLTGQNSFPWRCWSPGTSLLQGQQWREPAAPVCKSFSGCVFSPLLGKYQGLDLPGHRANVFTFIWNWPCFSKAFIPTPEKQENAGFSTSFWTTIIVSCFGFSPFQWFSFTFPW